MIFAIALPHLYDQPYNICIYATEDNVNVYAESDILTITNSLESDAYIEPRMKVEGGVQPALGLYAVQTVTPHIQEELGKAFVMNNTNPMTATVCHDITDLTIFQNVTHSLVAISTDPILDARSTHHQPNPLLPTTFRFYQVLSE